PSTGPAGAGRGAPRGAATKQAARPASPEPAPPRTPDHEVIEDAGLWIVTVEMPGAEADATTVTLAEGRLRIAATGPRPYALSLDLPEGVKFGSPRRGGGSVDDVQQMIFAAGLSVVFIYLLMGFLFESFVLPLSIVTTIPLAALGVVWGHFLSGVDMDSLGWVGGVLLIGVVVNNGIVLVDAVNRLRAEGMERTEALLASADRRFRPIMMTALTTICGMVPLLLGQTSSIGLSYKSFGVTLIGGMTVATLLTLLVVPVAYTFFDDVRRRLEFLMSRVFGGGKPQVEGADLDADAPDPAIAGG
ncbi:MAG: efflux RND transporter permease subunit, partial [Acidobacteriota bacterium]